MPQRQRGPGLLAGLLWGTGRSTVQRIVLCASAAALVGMATPIVRHLALIDSLPEWLQWYLRPAGEHSIFPLFPWAGFVAAGAATGGRSLAATTQRAKTEANQSYHHQNAFHGESVPC